MIDQPFIAEPIMTETRLRPTQYRPPNPFISNNIRVCPECAGPLARASGCVTCRQCGWGRCS